MQLDLSIKERPPLYYPANLHFPIPNVFLTHDKDVLTESPNKSKGGKSEPIMVDGEVVDSFGPSRLPPMVVFFLP